MDSSTKRAAEAYLRDLYRKAERERAAGKAMMAHWWRQATKAQRRRHPRGR